MSKRPRSADEFPHDDFFNLGIRRSRPDQIGLEPRRMVRLNLVATHLDRPANLVENVNRNRPAHWVIRNSSVLAVSEARWVRFVHG